MAEQVATQGRVHIKKHPHEEYGNPQVHLPICIRRPSTRASSTLLLFTSLCLFVVDAVSLGVLVVPAKQTLP